MHLYKNEEKLNDPSLGPVLDGLQSPHCLVVSVCGSLMLLSVMNILRFLPELSAMTYVWPR